jgi:hypothetical protein
MQGAQRQEDFSGWRNSGQSARDFGNRNSGGMHDRLHDHRYTGGAPNLAGQTAQGHRATRTHYECQ